MAWREGHGTGAGSPRIEVLPANELPAGVPANAKRQRVILTDDEVQRYLGAEGLDLELKLLSLTSRTEGGMRTAELTRWDWTMIDRDAFASCDILRAKTGDIQRLEIPEVLRPFLRVWHAKAEHPEAGPVSPVRRGQRRGEAKSARGTMGSAATGTGFAASSAET
jgi:integrase